MPWPAPPDAVGGLSSTTEAVLLKAVCSWLASLYSSLSHAAELFLFPLQPETYRDMKQSFLGLREE